MKCRSCGTALTDPFLDLGTAPPSNAFLEQGALASAEPWYPLKLWTCTRCFLVQVDDAALPATLFDADYAYHSSYSRSWVEHARTFFARAQSRLGLGADSFVVEVASNDGYLLQFAVAAGIPCLGIEPTEGTARVARSRGVETRVEFFGTALAREIAGTRRADLVVANNVLAHVPDLNDFIGGLAALVADEGLVSIEFPHLQVLVEQHQFDTVYHEHYSYFSLHAAAEALARHGLRVCDVERLPTHGGSLRVWAAKAASAHPTTPAVAGVLAAEVAAGMRDPGWYRGFQPVANGVKNALLAYLLEQQRAGRRVAGYGAAAKGNTLLNYAGVRPDLLPYVVDLSPRKQGRWLPGSRIPVVAEERLRAERPDVVLILPWNLRDEIADQLAYVRDWGGRFAVAVPELTEW